MMIKLINLTAKPFSDAASNDESFLTKIRNTLFLVEGANKKLLHGDQKKYRRAHSENAKSRDLLQIALLKVLNHSLGFLCSSG